MTAPSRPSPPFTTAHHGSSALGLQVRLRSLRSLRSKLDTGIVHPRELALDHALLRSLLTLMSQPGSAQLEALQALQILGTDPNIIRVLVGIGAIEQLSRVCSDSPHNEPVSAAASRLAERLTHLPANMLPLPEVPGLMAAQPPHISANRPYVSTSQQPYPSVTPPNAEQWTPPREAVARVLAGIASAPPPSSRTLTFDSSSFASRPPLLKETAEASSAKHDRIVASSLASPGAASYRCC